MLFDKSKVKVANILLFFLAQKTIGTISRTAAKYSQNPSIELRNKEISMPDQTNNITHVYGAITVHVQYFLIR